MKFVALALALLLAVGSQAAPMMADAPTQLQQARALADMYLTQFKTSSKNAVAAAGYPELMEKVDALYDQIKARQAQVSPMTDSAVTTIADATADIRAGIQSDIDTLKIQLQHQCEELRKIMERHAEEYRVLVEPIMQEYRARQVEMRARLEPVHQQLQAKIAVNAEETKAALLPMVETVHAKLSERLEAIKEAISPYVDEYREQLRGVYQQAQNINTDDINALKMKIEPLAEDIKTKLQEIFNIVTDTMSKN